MGNAQAAILWAGKGIAHACLWKVSTQPRCCCGVAQAKAAKPAFLQHTCVLDECLSGDVLSAKAGEFFTLRKETGSQTLWCGDVLC